MTDEPEPRPHRRLIVALLVLNVLIVAAHFSVGDYRPSVNAFAVIVTVLAMLKNRTPRRDPDV